MHTQEIAHTTCLRTTKYSSPDRFLARHCTLHPEATSPPFALVFGFDQLAMLSKVRKSGQLLIWQQPSGICQGAKTSIRVSNQIAVVLILHP